MTDPLRHPILRPVKSVMAKRSTFVDITYMGNSSRTGYPPPHQLKVSYELFVSKSDMLGFAGRLCSYVLKLRVWEGVSENGREDMWSRVGLVSHLVFGFVGRLYSCVLELGV
jgi:hypothetical protein